MEGEGTTLNSPWVQMFLKCLGIRWNTFERSRMSMESALIQSRSSITKLQLQETFSMESCAK